MTTGMVGMSVGAGLCSARFVLRHTGYGGMELNLCYATQDAGGVEPLPYGWLRSSDMHRYATQVAGRRGRRPLRVVFDLDMLFLYCFIWHVIKSFFHHVILSECEESSFPMSF